MTFVETPEEIEKQRKKEQEAIELIQEKKRKDLEDQIKKRGQDVKNHKPNVQNVDVSQQQNPLPPIAIINNLLMLITNKNFPVIKDIKNIDPKLLDITNAPLSVIINEITKNIESEFKRAGKEFSETEQLNYANQIFAVLRELKEFNFITIIPNTEEGILVKINPKALAYINAVGYLVPPHDFRNQYAVYHSLCLT